jgi:exopolyphosphatase / guanosine-5'-triphosphate,3'-diphosphate pyrophosphatase
LTAPLPLAQRRAVRGLPPKRADVFPAALATLLEVARFAGVDRFAHSFYNLRYGVVAEMLDGAA